MIPLAEQSGVSRSARQAMSARAGAMGNVSAPTNLCHRSGLNLGLP